MIYSRCTYIQVAVVTFYFRTANAIYDNDKSCNYHRCDNVSVFEGNAR